MRRLNGDRANEIRALKRMKDSEIDTTDIPPVSDWSGAEVGKFYKPIRRHFAAPPDDGGGVSRTFVIRLSAYGELAV